MTRTEFEALTCAYYDAQDSETLSHETIADAIEAHLDLLMEPGCDVSKVIRDHSPVVVRALRRMDVDQGWLVGVARNALEQTAEAFGETFGDPDAGDNGLDQEAEDAALPAMIEAVRAFVKHGDVWACEEVGSYTYTVEEVEALMREHRPDWFDEATRGD